MATTADARPALAVVTVAALAGLLLSTFVSPDYRARATLWLQKGDNAGLLRSRQVVDSAVRISALYLHPAAGADPELFRGFQLADRLLPGEYILRVDPSGAQWRLEVAEQVLADSGTAGDSVGRPMGLRWAPSAASVKRLAGREQPFTLNTPRDMIDKLRADLFASHAAGSHFVSLGLDDEDPVYAARALNAIANRYVVVANSRGFGPVVVLDSAVTPRTPFRNSRMAVVAKALLLGVGLGLCLILVQVVRASGVLGTAEGAPHNENRSVPVP